MKRISTDKQYLSDKTVVIDADGIPVDLTLLNGDKAVAAAERAARIAESTSWSGDRLTVNGKTSPSLSGPSGPEGIGNTTTVQTEAEAKALTGLPVGHKVYVVGTGTWYEVSSTMALKKISTISTASGPGWIATRSGGVVIVEFDGWDGTAITLPWLPVAQARAALSDLNQAQQARCTANTAGRVFVYGASATPKLYGQLTYLT